MSLGASTSTPSRRSLRGTIPLNSPARQPRSTGIRLGTSNAAKEDCKLKAGKYCALKYAVLTAVFIARTSSPDEIKSAPTDTTVGGGMAVLEQRSEEKKPDTIETY